MTNPSGIAAPQPTLIDILLAARRSLGGAGNRRRLFGRFDEIFDGLPPEPVEVMFDTTGVRAAFQFRRLLLVNWKAFERIDISFPELDTGRPVALIGGENGNGKTSILDAILTGLFGLQRFLETDQSALSEPPSESQAASKRGEYAQLLERAMHRPAFDRGERMMSVTLECDAAEGPLVIERRWFFDDAGAFHAADEELVLREGADHDIMPPPVGENAPEFYQQQIAQRLIGPTMAPFFLFDGEQVRRLSERDLGDQVRLGIEATLGIGTLRGLASDLTDFSRDRGRDLQADDAEAKLFAGIAEFETEHLNTQAEIASIEAKLAPLRRRRDQIVATIGSIGGGTYHARHHELEFRHSAEARLKSLRHDLMVSSTRSFPFALMGRELLDATMSSLAFETTVVSISLEQEKVGLQPLLTALAMTGPRFDPEAEATLVHRVRAAWESLHPHSASRGIADLHPYLKGLRADRVYENLLQARETAAASVSAAAKEISELADQIQKIDAEAANRRDVDAMRSALGSELDSLNVEIGALEKARRLSDQKIGRVESQLEPKRAEWQRRRLQRRATTPVLYRIEAASDLVEKIEGAIRDAVPTHYARLAEQVTVNYRALAHKRVVERIQILPSGEVQLVDGTGRVIRDVDPSAGESQVFAMALIAAVLDMCGGSVPLVIDTPLGRLDPAHRGRMLDFFVRRPTQMILLSQPDEVGGSYYERIADKIAVEYRLSYRYQDGDLGATIVEEGYFPRRAA